MNSKIRNIAFYGIMIALALVFSYLESFIPLGVLGGVPGVKLGLANIVVVFALYRRRFADAVVISVLRVLMSALLFGNVMTLAYSVAGGLLSLAVMALLRHTKLSVIGVSMVGGVTHNIGQLLVAMVLMGTTRVAYYVPVLLVAGLVTGFLMGVVAKVVIDRVSKIKD